jgi:integrase
VAERLTDRGISALRPAAACVYVFDSEVTGLAVRIYPSGVKSFTFDFRENGRQRRVTLGKFPVWTIGKARAHAGKLRLKADAGESVAPAKGSRVTELIEQWREVVRLTLRPSTAKAYDHMIDNHIVPGFGKDDVKAVTRNRVEIWHGKMAKRTPINANRCLGVLSSFMSWLERDHRIERNPCRGVQRRPENQRHTFLDEAEIAAAHAALRGDNFNQAAALALRLALLTGCRIGEAIGITASQIDAGRKLWIKPAATTKQKKLHIVPLQAEALAIAEQLVRIGPPDYESCKRCWERARKILDREDVHVHDLRHSRASALARSGASLMQIGRVLGHSAPATTQRYAHLVATDLADLVERTR